MDKGNWTINSDKERLQVRERCGPERKSMRLETERTLLRSFRIDDLDDLYEYASCPEMDELAGWKHHTSINESIHVLRMYLKDENALAIIDRENSRVIGHIVIYRDSRTDREDTKEIGFALHPDYWGRGIMTEVVTAVRDALAEQGILHIYACCIKRNEAAGHLLKKCGFTVQREGILTSEKLKKKFESREYAYHAVRTAERTVETVLMNLCMICDGNRVLVEDRMKEDYAGITFPGGHVERGESFTAAVIREVYEETGLRIAAPRLCGIKNWEEEGKRYIVFLYRTEQFEGSLKSSEEGDVYWVLTDELKDMRLAEGMKETMEIMLREELGEYFAYQKEEIWQGELL